MWNREKPVFSRGANFSSSEMAPKRETQKLDCYNNKWLEAMNIDSPVLDIVKLFCSKSNNRPFQEQLTDKQL